MMLANELRNGTVFVKNKIPYKVLNFEHVKVARGGATVRIKCRNLFTESVNEYSFGAGDRVDEADVENRNLQFLYKDSDNAYFMDTENYSQISIPVKKIQNEINYLIEGNDYQVMFFDDSPISVVLPLSLFFKVKSAPPAVKGNTATSATKIVILENGMALEVPQFIKEGNVVKVNTSTGRYSGRGK